MRSARVTRDVGEGGFKRNNMACVGAVRKKMRLLLSVCLLVAAIFLVGCNHDRSPGAEDIKHAREAYSKGLYLEAEKNYERYLQVEPQGKNLREAWERLSEIAIEIKGDLDRAVVLLEAMYLELGSDPHNAWRIMHQLGDVYAQLGNRPKAIESLERSLLYAEGTPERVFASQLRMAKLYRAMGSYDLVAVTLEDCADNAVDGQSKAICLYELAQSYSLISNWSQAKRALENLLDTPDVPNETRVLAIFLLADIYENERDYAKTHALLISIKDDYPNPKVIESRLASLPYIPPAEPVEPPAQ